MTEFEGYCVKCKAKVIADGEEFITKNNKKMLKGPCAKCGTNVCRILGKA